MRILNDPVIKKLLVGVFREGTDEWVAAVLTYESRYPHQHCV